MIKVALDSSSHEAGNISDSFRNTDNITFNILHEKMR